MSESNNLFFPGKQSYLQKQLPLLTSQGRHISVDLCWKMHYLAKVNIYIFYLILIDILLIFSNKVTIWLRIPEINILH